MATSHIFVPGMLYLLHTRVTRNEVALTPKPVLPVTSKLLTGSIAMGPVGRNRCQTVLLGTYWERGREEEREEERGGERGGERGVSK